MKTKTIVVVLMIIVSMGIGAFALRHPNEVQLNNQNMSSIYEIAINQSKEGAHDSFLSTRQKFVEVLGKEEATLNEGKWDPFFTVIPDLDLSRILIGMTHWNSMPGFGEAAARLLPQKEAVNYFSSFDPLAYALLEPVDGKSFDMNSIKKAGTVVEFAIRRGTTPDAFGEKRDTFFDSLAKYDGFQFAREFKVNKLNEQSIPVLAENTQAVIIVWESAEKFHAAAQPIFASSEYEEFAANLEIETYFASNPTE
ncbi:MAG: hypothetical protein AAF391_06365 [Bacteroidota bacterium]